MNDLISPARSLYLLIFIPLVLFISILLTNKLGIKKFNNSFIRIFCQELKSIFIIVFFTVLTFILGYNNILPNKMLLPLIIILIFIDVIILFVILIFKKESNDLDTFSNVLLNDQISLPIQRPITNIHLLAKIIDHIISSLKIEKELSSLFRIDSFNSIAKVGEISRIASISDLNALNSNSMQFIKIDTKMNSIPELNKNLTHAYRLLKNYGILLIGYEDFHDNIIYGKIQKSKFTRLTIGPIHFFITRFFPKFPIIHKLYFHFTKKKYLTLSRAESWGRLHYLGFEVLHEIKVNSISYLLAQKKNTPSNKKNPTYFPIVNLRRVCSYGKIGVIYKIRTMYPYSEYIQKKIYEMNKLSEIGKFKDDFRITSWGKYFRKYYIDEIPQILNFLRGDIKLVGIRAMSEHYFSLYSAQYHELYFKVKPGFFSPLPETKINSFDEGARVEYEYLEQFLISPFMTDLKYFVKISKQLIFQNRLSS